MRKVQPTGSEITRPGNAGNTTPGTSWVIHLIHAIERCLRPSKRKRTVTYKTKEFTKEGYFEKEITYKDEY